MKQFDIFCVSETRAKEGVQVTNFTCFDLNFDCKPIKYQYPGIHGLTVYIRDNLAANCYLITNEDFQCKSVIWVKIENKLILGALYLPYEGADHHYGDLFEDLTSDININRDQNLPILLIGDFNSRTGSLNEINVLDHSDEIDNYTFPNIINLLETSNIPFERKNLDKKTNNNGKKLINMCNTTELCIVNGRFGSDKNIGNRTCGNISTIDYAICSPDLFPFITDFKIDVFDPLLSDKHNPICITLESFKDKKQPNTSNQEIPLATNNIFKSMWKNESKDHFKKSFDMGKINLFSLKVFQANPDDITHGTMDRLTNLLNNIFLEPAKITGMHKELNKRPNKPIKKNNKPWYNKQCKLSTKGYIKFKKQLSKPPNENEKSQLNALAKTHRKLIRKVRRAYNSELNDKLKILKTKGQKEFWQILNQGKKTVRRGNIPLSDLQNHFSALGADQRTNKEPITEPQNQQTNGPLNVPFTLEELVKHIKKLKNNKTPGIDYILNEFIKYCPEELHYAIVDFFNLVLESGKVPSEWTVGIIKAIYKNKGDINDVNNYRGITLLSCLGKLFTSIINSRLYDHVTKNNILGNEQVGFRPKHSTLDHIFALQVISHFYISQGKQLFCAFVDYSKAFDFIDRTYLWQKLLESNINGKILKVIRNMYDNAKSHVSDNNNLSDPFPCQVGVRQGENLSPLLFAMFLNDFKQFLKEKYNGLKRLSASILKELNIYFKIFCLLYADDTIILAESPAQLLRALDALNEYCNKWGLKVNVDKTKILIFSKGKVTKHKSFKFGANKIEVVFDYVYLGTKFNHNGKFEVAMAKHKLKANKAKFNLMAKARQLNLPVDTFVELLEKLVIPILLYGSEIWGYEDPKQLQVMLNHTLRRYLRLHKTTPSCMLIGELGLKEVSQYIENRMLNFWYKIVTGDEDKITSILYKWLLDLYNQNITNHHGYTN